MIEFLLLRGEREMALATLRAMAAGGIHDQLGGGFARYSVDATWTVPHFEKMLYDNALLARAYLHGWQATGEARLREVCVRHARLGAARDARPRGRLLLARSTPTPRASRAASTCGRVRRAARAAGRGRRRRDRLARGERGGQLRRPAPPRAGAERAARTAARAPSPQASARAHPRAAARGARDSACARRSTTSG